VRRRHRGPPFANRCAARSLRAPLLLALLLLAACESGGAGPSAAGAGPSGSVTPVGSATNAGAAGAPTATATPVELTTPGAPVGIAGLCTLSPSVSAQLPASIPAYPHAQIRLGQSSGGSGLFGFCTRDGVAAVGTFYVSELPGAGWQLVSNTKIDATQQLMADRSTAHVIVTILPDSQVAGATDLVITTSGL